MFEKLKDILYETSDILLALVIILLMSSVITWKVTDSLAYTQEKGSIFAEIAQQSSVEKPEEDDDVADTQEVIVISSAPEEQTQLNETVTAEVSGQEQTAAQASSAPPPTKPEPPKPAPTVASIIRIDIPSGTSGSGIAKLLKDKGLIDNTAKFIARVEELKLSSKLKSDTFEIPSGTPLDDIIYIITGTKR